MKIDQKPREFCYVNHKQNYPLELKGTMRHRVRPQSSSDLSRNQPLDNTLTSNLKLQQKIIENYQNLKSIIPTQLQAKHTRKNSIRTFNNQTYQNMAGAALLMSKQQNKRMHPEKKHLTEKDINQKQQGKKQEQKNYHKQRRHYIEEQKQKQGKQLNYIPRKHAQTLMRKIDNDLYSHMQVKDNIPKGTVKMSKKNLHSQGFELGYQKSRNYHLSCAKKRQISGNMNNSQIQVKKNYRDDWRKTSFILG